MSRALAGKIAPVTGGSPGIGRAVAERSGADEAAVVNNFSGNGQKTQQVVNRVFTKPVPALSERILGECDKRLEEKRSDMKFSLVPLLLTGQSVSPEVRQALRENRLKDAAQILMKQYGLSCVEASDLVNISACD